MVVAAPATLLVPASPMPVASKIWCFLGYHHQMTDARIDDRFTPRTDVGLARLIRLDWLDDLTVGPIKGSKWQVGVNQPGVFGHGWMLRQDVRNQRHAVPHLTGVRWHHDRVCDHNHPRSHPVVDDVESEPHERGSPRRLDGARCCVQPI